MLSRTDRNAGRSGQRRGALEQIGMDLTEGVPAPREPGGLGVDGSDEERRRHRLARKMVRTIGRGAQTGSSTGGGNSNAGAWKAGAPEAELRASVCRDLHLAAAAYEAMSEGGMVLQRRPIRSVGDLTRILYQECEPRFSLKRGDEPGGPVDILSAVERLGLRRRLDCHVVGMAMASLAGDPDLALSVNLSGQSAMEDEWWEPIFACLESFPDMARRLVIEMSEGARFAADRARRFRNRLRHLECHVAIDHFGVGFGLSSSIEMREPDLVKIDRSILRRAVAKGGQQLHGLIRIASDLAPIVVVDGVDSEQDLHAAEAAGARWIQGRYVDYPFGTRV